MEIRLTDEEIREAIRSLMERHGGATQQTVYRAIARAQVAKVDEVLFAPWEAKLQSQIDAEGYIEHQVRLDVALRTIQAARQVLRAAGEGE